MRGPTLPEVTIHVLRGKASAASRVMKGRSLLIGSGPHCDIEMRSADVASKHALITRDEQGVTARALDHEFPLLLNGAPIVESTLAGNDKLGLGPFELSLSIEGLPVVKFGDVVSPVTDELGDVEAPSLQSDPTELDGRARDLEHFAQRLNGRRARLLRVRRKVLAQLRQRRQNLDDLALTLGQRAEDLDRQRATHDAGAKQISDELEARQAELKRIEVDVTRRLEVVERCQCDLDERKRTFESDVQATHALSKSLQAREMEVQHRATEVSKAETALLALRTQVDEQQMQADARSSELQLRHEEIEARFLALGKRVRQINEQSVALDQQRLQLEELEGQCRDRQVEVDRTGAEIDAMRLQIEEDRSELVSTRTSLQDLAKQLALREANILESEQRAAEVQREIQSRWAEVDQHAQTVHERLESNRTAIDAKRREVDEMHLAATARIEELERKREEWFTRLAEVREIAKDLAERQSLAGQQRRDGAGGKERGGDGEMGGGGGEVAPSPIIPAQAGIQASRTGMGQGGEVAEASFRRTSNFDPRTTRGGGGEEERANDNSCQPLSLADDEVASAVTDAGLMSESKIQWYRQSASGRRVRLVDELLRGKALTRYQIQAAVNKEWDALRLGTASVLDVLHVGCVATTYRVLMPGCDDPLAARMLQPQWSRDPARRRQHQIVLESLKEFRHPNIVASHGSLSDGERFGALTEYIESNSLLQIADRAIPPSVLVSICCQAVRAVVAAEREGLVHGNIRPSRLLLTPDGTVRLVGFGEPAWLSKIHRCEKGRTIGTFVAPEIAQVGVVVDARADLYSIAQVCQQLALHGTSSASLLESDVADDYPEDFRLLLSAMLSPTPAQRPRPAEALAALDAILDPKAIQNWPDFVLLLHDEAVPPTRRAA